MFDSYPLDAHEFAARFPWPWPGLDASPSRAEGRIAIVGRPGAGKKTLCNSLWGWGALTENTLEEQPVRRLGLFTLVTPTADTQDDSAITYPLKSADLILYLVDGTVEPVETDVRWIARLRALPPAILIVLNTFGHPTDDLTPERLADLQDRFARPVLKLDVGNQQAAHEHLLPVVLRMCPGLAVPLAAEITSLRWKVVQQLIRESAIMSGLASLENGVTVDIPALLDLQRRLVRQIARVYGYAEDDEHAQTSLISAAQRALLHALARMLNALGPVGQKLAALLIGTSGTWAVGQKAQMRYRDANGVPLRWRALLPWNGRHDAGTPSG